MDYQTTYNEVIIKLAEAKKCQDKLADNNDELRQVNHAIAEISKILYSNINNTRQYLFSRHNSLNNEINNCTRERDEKLNEAMSKALDIVDDETSNETFCFNSLGAQAMELIFSCAKVYNIHWQYSIEVEAKFAKIIIKRISTFNQFLNQQRMFGY